MMNDILGIAMPKLEMTAKGFGHYTLSKEVDVEPPNYSQKDIDFVADVESIISKHRDPVRQQQIMSKYFTKKEIDDLLIFETSDQELQIVIAELPYIMLCLEDGIMSWRKHEARLIKIAPQILHMEKFNWESLSYLVAIYAPDYIIDELYNWKDYSWTVAKHCPHKINKKFFDWGNGGKHVL